MERAALGAGPALNLSARSCSGAGACIRWHIGWAQGVGRLGYGFYDPNESVC